MKVYRFSVQYEWVGAHNHADSEVFRGFDGTSRSAGWSPVPVKLVKQDEQGGPLAESDFPWLGEHACGGHIFIGGQCGAHIFVSGLATRSRLGLRLGSRSRCLFALLYSCLRLLLDLVDVRLRVRDPEAGFKSRARPESEFS